MIWSIYCGENGMVWFGTVNGLSRYDGKNFTNETRLGRDPIFAIHGSNDGTLWLGTYSGGVVGYDGTAFTSLDTRDGLADNAVYDI